MSSLNYLTTFKQIYYTRDLNALLTFINVVNRDFYPIAINLSFCSDYLMYTITIDTCFNFNYF